MRGSIGRAEVDKSKKVGTTGYCMGGPQVFRTAAAVPNRVGAACTFHGGGLVTKAPDSPHLLIPQMKASFLFAVAENDDMREPDAKNVLKEEFAKAKLAAEVEVYPAAHGWCPPDTTVYNKDAAEKALPAEAGDAGSCSRKASEPVRSSQHAVPRTGHTGAPAHVPRSPYCVMAPSTVQRIDQCQDRGLIPRPSAARERFGLQLASRSHDESTRRSASSSTSTRARMARCAGLHGVPRAWPDKLTPDVLRRLDVPSLPRRASSPR